MTESSTTICPVPSEQQPLNEYQQMKESWLFDWVTMSKLVYGRKLTWVWLWGWIVAGPIAAASFPPAKSLLPFVISGAAGALIPVVLVLLRIYSGWLYVSDRLSKETVVYEESGWYDGQTWCKPESVLARDRLIVAYEIQPILTRLKVTFAILGILLTLMSLIWLIAAGFTS